MLLRRCSGWVFVLLALFACLPSMAQPRILLIGDSWTEYIWDKNAWPPVLDSYGMSQWSVLGEQTAIGGTPAALYAADTPNPRDGGLPILTGTVRNILDSNPTVDVIHISLGGIDLLGLWNASFNASQNDAMLDEIQGSIETVVDFILAERPDIRIGLVGYDYLNLWETSLGGIASAQAFQAFLGNPSPSQINDIFRQLGLRQRAIASARPRVGYVHNFGLQQYRHGHPGFWDAGFVFRPAFGAGLAPLPGWGPGYSPYPGGVSQYPSPRAALDLDGDDPIHLNTTGYKDICASALGQYFALWLSDITGPEVFTLVRADVSPTTAQLLHYTITFTESIQSLDAGDFALDITGGISGAAITDVTGSGTTWTVTVDRGVNDGTLSIDFIDDDTVLDLSGRPAGNDLEPIPKPRFGVITRVRG